MPDIGPGPESKEVILTEWKDIPWDDLAFPSVTWALKNYSTGANANVKFVRHPENS